MMIRKGFISHLSREDGGSLIELSLTLPLFFLLLFGAVDFGRAYYLAMEIAGAAHAGAEYGAQNPTDTTGMQAAARADAPDVPGLTVTTPSYGCECSDGTLFSASCTTTPSCTTNVVYRVTVPVSVKYKPLIPWPMIPSSMTISNSATMRSGGS